jgi:hypothetical protein
MDHLSLFKGLLLASFAAHGESSTRRLAHVVLLRDLLFCVKHLSS